MSENMSEIIVDGVRFIRAVDGPIKIVVMERGFVYVGKVVNGTDGVVTIHGARSIIRWGTTGHLGGLVDGPLVETRLGAPCVVTTRIQQVIHTIEVNQNGWGAHIS